jgi:hypothetical protein
MLAPQYRRGLICSERRISACLFLAPQSKSGGADFFGQCKERKVKANQPIIENISESDRSGVDFLVRDVMTGLIFLDLAEITKSAEQRSRHITEAHRAYKIVLAVLPRLKPTGEQMEILRGELETLKDRLLEAGVSIHDEI